MAQSGSFQRDVGGIGVPNTVQPGVTDTSAASLVSALGGAALEARAGFEEARLESGIEQDIGRLEGNEDPVADMTSFAGVSNLLFSMPGTGTSVNPLEMPLDTQTERDVQQDARSLKQARESGSLTHGEFMARTQALTRSAISRLPGRADTFRKIMSDTLGDHSDRISPAQELARQRAASATAANKAQQKLENDAFQMGVTPEFMQALNFDTATKAMRNEQRGIAVTKYWANQESLVDRELEGVTRQIQQATGQVVLDPGNMRLAIQGMNESAEQQKARISAKAAEEGWDIAQVNGLHKKVDSKVKSEKEALNELNAITYMEDYSKYREGMIENGMFIRNPTMAWGLKNHPWLIKEGHRAAEAWRQRVGHLDPTNPNHAAEFERKERLWQKDFGFLEGTGVYKTGWQKGEGLEASEFMNAEAEKFRALGIPIEMSKAAAATIATSPIETEQDRDAMHEAIKRLADTSDGDGMSIAGAANPQVVARVAQDPQAQAILKQQMASEISGLVRNYGLDAKVVRDIGEARGLMFGPAYDMKFADEAVKAATPGPKDIFVGKGLGRQPIGIQGVDENYRAGVESIGRLVDAYRGTPIFDGMGGQEWVAERLKQATGFTEQAQGEPEVELSPFERLKRFVFGEPEQAEPAASGQIIRDEQGEAVDVQQEAAAPSEKEEFEPQASRGKTTVSTSEDITRSESMLNLIGDKESTGNYNAHFGNAQQSAVDFTDMSIDEVLAWQRQFVRQGSPSSAVGKYQIIRKTLTGLKKDMGLSGSEPFDENMQDSMAVTLLNRRGLQRFLKGSLSREKFANNIAKEWASFPIATDIGKKKAGSSFYAGDGLNKALIDVDDVLSALNDLDTDQSLSRVEPGIFVDENGDLVEIS